MNALTSTALVARSPRKPIWEREASQAHDLGAKPFDCQSCGACCVKGGDVPVFPSDQTPARLTRSVRGLMGYASYEADEFRIMKRVDGRCAALCTGESGSCRCLIYDRRPQVCAQFSPGSEACLAARAA